MSKITLKVYDYDEKKEKVVGETSTYILSRSMDTEQTAKLLEDYINAGMKDFREGNKIGKVLSTTHPSLQGSIIRFCVGIILGISIDKEFTDARNEVPVEFGKELARRIESGEFKLGYMI